VIKPEKAVSSTMMVQPATQLTYAAFPVTEQFIILYGPLTYPIWQYVTNFCGEPQKTVLK